MPDSDSQDGFFYLPLTAMIDPYILVGEAWTNTVEPNQKLQEAAPDHGVHCCQLIQQL